LSAFIAISVYIAMSSRLRANHIQDSAQHLKLLFENLPGMAYAGPVRESWPLNFVSDGCKALCGYDKTDFEQQTITWNQLIHPEDRQGVWERTQTAISYHIQFELEYRINTKSGKERWVWERGRVSDNTKNQELEIEGFIADITDRKNTEIELLQSLNFGEAILDTAVEAVITFDSNRCIETFNHAAQKMFDRTLSDVMGQRMDILASKILRQEYVDNIFDHIYATATATPSSLLFYRQEGVGERRNGTVFPAEFVTTELEHQSERKFVCLIRDISKQRAAEDEAREHRDKLAHVDRLNTLGEMASGIAHEVNQPLTAISLFAEGGKRLVGSGQDDKLKAIFDKMSQHAIRAGAVIERMQSMVRQQEGVREVVDCNAIVKSVVTLAEADARARGIIIKVDLFKKLPVVNVDTVQIQQVILNLLRNGMDAMQSALHKSGNTIHIRSRLLGNGQIEVSVTDYGTGVSENVADKIFNPFSTTKSAGMGLGLSISSAIITSHGGQLNFRNNESNGATFRFTLLKASQEIENA
jgi:two-component system sensor kinase FixL